ncbi:hypothetical protein [Ferruginibacter sp.]
MNKLHLTTTASGKTDQMNPLPFLEGSAAVLGLLSFLFNALFCLLVMLMIRTSKVKQLPVWLVIVNFILLLAQIYWFIFDKSK